MKLIKTLLAIAGLCLGIYWGLNIYRFSSFDVEELRLEKYSEILAKDTNKTFLPDINDRLFWDSPPYTLPLISEESFRTSDLSGAKLIEAGTLQLCLYPQNTFWIRPIEDAIKSFLDKYHFNSSGGNDGRRFIISPEVTSVGSALANSISVLRPVLSEEIVDQATQWIQVFLLSSFLNDYEKSKNETLSWSVSFCPWIEDNFYWTPACTTDILYIALAVEEDLDKKSKIVKACVDLSSSYFRSVGAEGGYPGGIRYWSSHFYYYIVMAERLLQASSGEINLYQRDWIMPLLRYPYDTMVVINDGLVGQFYPVFGDNSNPEETVRWSLKLLEDRVDAWYPSLPIDVDASVRYYYDVLNSPYRIRTDKFVIPRPTKRTLFLSSGLTIYRDFERSMVFSSKGASPHDLNSSFDVGSFTIFGVTGAGASELVGEGGKEITPFNNVSRSGYRRLAKNYFLAKPLPVIDGFFQSLPNISQQSVVFYDLTSSKDKLTYNLAPFYDVQGLEVLRRIITSDGEGLTVRDEFEASRPIKFQTLIPIRMLVQSSGNSSALLSSPEVVFSFDFHGSSDLDVETFLLESDGLTRVYSLSLEDTQLRGFIEYKLKIRK